MSQKTMWTGWHTVALMIIIAAIAVVGLLIPSSSRLFAWIGTLLLLLIFLTISGQGITGRWLGMLIDARNKISLSRLQMVLWTILVLSGFLAVALSNISAGDPTPLSIKIPAELWLLMGISTTTLVGSPLIASTKSVKNPDIREEASTFNLMAKQGVDMKKVDSKGLIVINDNPSQARWSDLFKGDESGNAAHLDLSKIQMFFFTLILVLAYGVALGSMLATAGVIKAFPALDPSMLAIMGISHGGYLTNKAIPHSRTA